MHTRCPHLMDQLLFTSMNWHKHPITLELYLQTTPPNPRSYIDTVETVTRDPETIEWPATGDRLLAAVVLFDIIKYTSDERPPLFKDSFLVLFRPVSHCSPHMRSNAQYGSCSSFITWYVTCTIIFYHWLMLVKDYKHCLKCIHLEEYDVSTQWSTKACILLNIRPCLSI